MVVAATEVSSVGGGWPARSDHRAGRLAFGLADTAWSVTMNVDAFLNTEILRGERHASVFDLFKSLPLRPKRRGKFTLQNGIRALFKENDVPMCRLPCHVHAPCRRAARVSVLSRV